jgi:hypothetical protein
MTRVQRLPSPTRIITAVKTRTNHYETTAQITRDLDRDSKAILDFGHEVQETSGKIGEFELSEVCEADEVYMTAREKGRGDFEGDKPPVLTLVRRCGLTDEFDSSYARIYRKPTKKSQPTAMVVLFSVRMAIRSMKISRRRGDWTVIWPSPTPIPPPSVMLTRTPVRTGMASFANGWRSLEVSRSTTSRNISTFLH